MNEDKNRQVQKHLQGMKRDAERPDRKTLRDLQKRRKAKGKSGRRRRERSPEEWLDESDSANEESFERMKSRRDLKTRGAPIDASHEVAESPSNTQRDKAMASLLMVASVFGDRAELIDQTGDRVSARIPHELASSDIRPVIGDQVETKSTSSGLSIASIAKRKSWLARPDRHHAGRQKLLAANVDLAVITVSLFSPKLKPGLIDRMLVALARTGVTPIVALTKIDLGETEDLERALAVDLAAFISSGVEVVPVSSETLVGVETMRKLLASKTVVFVGQSGVGKSSLLNAIHPKGNRLVGDVRAKDGKGRHTTTTSSLYVFDNGTRLMDTPGIREFGLWANDLDYLRTYFSGFEAVSEPCKFRDCLHQSEPHCAVQLAVKNGDVSEVRYDSWLRLIASLGEIQ